MKEIQSPHKRENKQKSKLPTIFLAGSIEMDSAEHWQSRILNDIKDTLGVAFNPRRDTRDSNRIQSIDNPQFVEQVHREEDHLMNVDLALFYFDPKTKSPITIGELNLLRGLDKKAVVYCPEGFWRKGNIDIACERSKEYISQVLSYKSLVQYIKDYSCRLISERYTSSHIKQLGDNQIFVFGSNEEGKHHGGSAKDAYELFGAEWGIGVGPTGLCYAIPTMKRSQTEAQQVILCDKGALNQYFKQFFEYTREHTHKQFLFTRVGCGAAGWGVDYMKKLFWSYYKSDIDTNITYPIEFEQDRE